MAHSSFRPLLITSITGSCFLSGFLFSLSYVSIPTILKDPNIPEVTLVTLWHLVYWRGFHVSPFLAVFSGICSMTNAYFLRSSNRNKANRLTLAGILMASVVPYTFAFVFPTNRIMMARQQKLLEAQNREVINGNPVELETAGTMQNSRRLAQKWAKLNYLRAALPAAGALLAWTTW